jgi:TrmH family RNA methyltransferase
MEPGFHKVSYRQNPDGYLAVLPALTTELAALDLPENPLIVVCSAIEKPGNLGAILRTADAAGVDAVISTESITDWGNPNVIRASRGTVFTVPIADSTRETLVPWLQERGITILATTPHTPTPFTEVDLTSGVAIIMGSEQDGLSPAWLAAADTQVTIPMHGQVNSLNVATSAALLIYEARRQRHIPA